MAAEAKPGAVRRAPERGGRRRFVLAAAALFEAAGKKGEGMFRRTLAVSVTTGVLLALVASQAQAATPGAGCTVSGKAAANVKILGGSGTYLFQSGAGVTPLTLNCVVTDGNGKAAVQTLSVPSPGHFRNQVCGTGTADGTNGPITLTTVAGDASLAGLWAGHILSYHLQFVGGQGALVFIRDSIYGDPNATVSGGGPISITADFDGASPPPAGTDCTSHFEVQGALAVIFTPSTVSDPPLHPGGT